MSFRKELSIISRQLWNIACQFVPLPLLCSQGKSCKISLSKEGFYFPNLLFCLNTQVNEVVIIFSWILMTYCTKCAVFLFKRLSEPNPLNGSIFNIKLVEIGTHDSRNIQPTYMLELWNQLLSKVHQYSFIKFG